MIQQKADSDLHRPLVVVGLIMPIGYHFVKATKLADCGVRFDLADGMPFWARNIRSQFLLPFFEFSVTLVLLQGIRQ